MPDEKVKKKRGRKKGKRQMKLEGAVHNRWTVVGLADPPQDSRRRYYYLCRCKCGTIKRVRSDHLVGNKSTQCRRCSGRREAQLNLPGNRYKRRMSKKGRGPFPNKPIGKGIT